MSETIVQPFPKSTANRKLCVQIFNAWNHIQQAYCDVYPALKQWMDDRKLFIKPLHDTCRYTRSNKRLLHIHKHTYQQLNMFIIFFPSSGGVLHLGHILLTFSNGKLHMFSSVSAHFFSSFFFGRLFYWVILCVWMFYFACSGAICLQVLVWDYLLSALKHNRCERTNEYKNKTQLNTCHKQSFFSSPWMLDDVKSRNGTKMAGGWCWTSCAQFSLYTYIKYTC